MKKFCLFTIVVLTVAQAAAQEVLDRLDEKLTWSTREDGIRARLSGTLDLEFYSFQQPAPGLIDSERNNLFNPRLSLFLDAQLGPTLYFFSQARFDRHFDPSDEGAQARLDEYALRFTPWSDGRVSLQVGKFATVFGRWVERHLSWDNPFITAPLLYEYVTTAEDFTAAYIPFFGDLRDEKFEYIPVVWGPSYASGVSVAGRVWHFHYAGEIKNVALSARPESWDATRLGFDHPTFTGRLGFQPNESWNFGFSASDGTYFRPEAQGTLPTGRDIDDFHQRTLAQDISYAHGHLQLWAEFHEVRFELPRLGDADAFGYFLEAKYKFFPQLFAAVRWNQMFFDDINNGVGGRNPWAHDISRLELAVTYRFTEHMHLKLEYYVEDETRAERNPAHDFAAQFTVRF